MRVLVAGATSVPGLRPRSKRPKDFEPAKKLWSIGASNLVAQHNERVCVGSSRSRWCSRTAIRRLGLR